MMLADDPRVRLLGSRAGANAYLDEYALSPPLRAWNMQTTVHSRMVLHNPRGNAAARAFGTDLRMVVPLHGVRRAPLSVQLESPLRIGPVPFPLLVADEVAFLAGPHGTHLTDTFWALEDPELVGRAADAYLAVWHAATPVEELDLPQRLPDRTFEVALRLIDGLTDREIAAALDVSERTVSAEVSRVVAWTGARSRGHAVALLVGAG
jgi:DNA-binding CsgD family transcriptional regulator